MNFKSVVWSPSQSTWKKEGGKGFERVLFVVNSGAWLERVPWVPGTREILRSYK